MVVSKAMGGVRLKRRVEGGPKEVKGYLIDKGSS